MKIQLDGILIFPVLPLLFVKVIIKCKHHSFISFSNANTLILVPCNLSKANILSTRLLLMYFDSTRDDIQGFHICCSDALWLRSISSPVFTCCCNFTEWSGCRDLVPWPKQSLNCNLPHNASSEQLGSPASTIKPNCFNFGKALHGSAPLANTIANT